MEGLETNENILFPANHLSYCKRLGKQYQSFTTFLPGINDSTLDLDRVKTRIARLSAFHND